jgi:hypothetical protein
MKKHKLHIKKRSWSSKKRAVVVVVSKKEKREKKQKEKKRELDYTSFDIRGDRKKNEKKKK